MNKENEFFSDLDISDDFFDVSKGNASQLQIPKLTLEGPTLEDSTNLSAHDITPDFTPHYQSPKNNDKGSKPAFGILKQQTPQNHQNVLKKSQASTNISIPNSKNRPRSSSSRFTNPLENKSSIKWGSGPTKSVETTPTKNNPNIRINNQSTPTHNSRNTLSTSRTPSKSSLRVTFGRDLSPQLFTTHDPPNTPIKRGEQQNSGKLLKAAFLKPGGFRKTPFRTAPKNIFQKNNAKLPIAPSPVPSRDSKSILSVPGMSTPAKQMRVRFNRDLSPELYDRNLPPNTPLRRGERIFNSSNTCMFINANNYEEFIEKQKNSQSQSQTSNIQSTPTKSSPVADFKKQEIPMPIEELSFQFSEDYLDIEASTANVETTGMFFKNICRLKYMCKIYVDSTRSF